MTWDVTTPAGSEAQSLGDDRIRELKVDIQTSLRGDDTEGVEAIFPGDDTANPVFRYRGLKGLTAARPTAGYYGLYANTTTNMLQRDNGSTWDDIATLIPAGTVMVFYQAAAPVGWTKVTTHNDKTLRVVSGSGGGSGGTVLLSAGLGHTHTVASHVHAIAAAAVAHRHKTPIVILTNTHSLGIAHVPAPFGTSGDATGSAVALTGAEGGAGADRTWQLTDAMESFAAGNTNGTSLTSDSTDAGSLAYVDVIVASKD